MGGPHRLLGMPGLQEVGHTEPTPQSVQLRDPIMASPIMKKESYGAGVQWAWIHPWAVQEAE